MTADGNRNGRRASARRPSATDPFAGVLGAHRGSDRADERPGPSFRARARLFFENVRDAGLAGVRPLDTVGRVHFALKVEPLGYLEVGEHLDSQALLLAPTTPEERGPDREHAVLLAVLDRDGHYERAWLYFPDCSFGGEGDER